MYSNVVDKPIRIILITFTYFIHRKTKRIIASDSNHNIHGKCAKLSEICIEDSMQMKWKEPAKCIYSSFE